MTDPQDTVPPAGSKQRKRFDPYRYDAATLSPQVQAELVRMQVPLVDDEALQRPSSLDAFVRSGALRVLQQRWLPIALVAVAATVSLVLILTTTPPRSAAVAPKASVAVPARMVHAATPGELPTITIVPSIPFETPTGASAAPSKRSTPPSKPNPNLPKPGASDDLEVPFIHL
jgi:hypothetical protein